MGIALLSGREFTEYDAKQTPPVAIINETLARNWFRGESPLGKRIRLNLLGRDQYHLLDKPVLAELVGIARDSRERSLISSIGPTVYVPQPQFAWWETSVVLRTRIDPRYATRTLQHAIADVDPEQPVSWIRTMDELASESASVPRLYTTLLGSFAGIALLLSVISIYGVVAYSVAQRTREIGIRAALGASARDIVRTVMGQAGAATVIGIAVGLPIWLGLGRTMAGMLWVSTAGIGPMAAASALLFVTALLASYVPARKAAGIDPMAALRCE
jgi:putative ABC transport system permease protein